MLVLLQRQINNAPQNQAAAEAGVLSVLGFVCLGVLVTVALFAVQIFFLLTLSRCFKEISPRNRQMEPGQVWLCLIPVFGFIWFIMLVLKLSDSLRDEYEERGLDGDGDFGKTLGI